MLHLKLRMGINIDNELIEEAEEEGPDEVIKIFKGLRPTELSLELRMAMQLKIFVIEIYQWLATY